jgi:hypothetical protein
MPSGAQRGPVYVDFGGEMASKRANFQNRPKAGKPNGIRRDPAALLKEHLGNPFPSKSHSPWDPSFGAPHAVLSARAMRDHAHGHHPPGAWAVSAHHWRALEYSCLVHVSSPKTIECAQSYDRSCVGAFPDHHVRWR